MKTMEQLKAPFPWFGGKSRCADLIWSRFGDVPNYVEPFAGSLATLLSRPHEPRAETINDIDCMVSNFWRCVRLHPEETAHHADWPINEADLHARHQWLVTRSEFRERMKVDLDFCDPQIAGYWVWGVCQWIGGGFCRERDMEKGKPGMRARPNTKLVGVNKLPRKIVDLRRSGHGVLRKRPLLNGRMPGVFRKRVNLRRGGFGIFGAGLTKRQMPTLGGDGSASGRGILRWGVPEVVSGAWCQVSGIEDWFRALQYRLRRVRVCCGDFARILGPSPTWKIGLTGVLLDPPYGTAAERDPDLYASDDLEVAARAQEWALANGRNSKLRIALCGLAGEHAMPDDWECVAWKAAGGYGNQRGGNVNKARERIWFSPHCLKP